MEQKWASGPFRGKMPPARQKKCPGPETSRHLGGHVSYFWAHCWRSFFDVFFEVLFFAPWVTFGRPRCPKGSQSEAKIELKGSLRAPCGKCFNNCIYCMGGIWGGLGAALGSNFSRLCLRAFSGGPLESILQILGDLGFPLGLLGLSFWSQNCDFFQGLILGRSLDHFGEGPAAGQASPVGPRAEILLRIRP